MADAESRWAEEPTDEWVKAVVQWVLQMQYRLKSGEFESRP